jgi:hypothetical protein
LQWQSVCNPESVALPVGANSPTPHSQNHAMVWLKNIKIEKHLFFNVSSFWFLVPRTSGDGDEPREIGDSLYASFVLNCVISQFYHTDAKVSTLFYEFEAKRFDRIIYTMESSKMQSTKAAIEMPSCRRCIWTVNKNGQIRSGLGFSPSKQPSCTSVIRNILQKMRSACLKI